MAREIIPAGDADVDRIWLYKSPSGKVRIYIEVSPAKEGPEYLAYLDWADKGTHMIHLKGRQWHNCQQVLETDEGNFSVYISVGLVVTGDSLSVEENTRIQHVVDASVFQGKPEFSLRHGTIYVDSYLDEDTGMFRTEYPLVKVDGSDEVYIEEP